MTNEEAKGLIHNPIKRRSRSHSYVEEGGLRRKIRERKKKPSPGFSAYDSNKGVSLSRSLSLSGSPLRDRECLLEYIAPSPQNFGASTKFMYEV